MPAFKQVRDVFDLSRRAHRHLSALYERLAHQADRQRVKLLLDYLSRHEANLQSCLQRCQQDLSAKLLDVWLQYVPEALPWAEVDALLATPDITVDQVTDLALRLDAALVEFYAELAENAESREVRELFENLRQMAVAEEVSLKRDADEL